MVKTESWYHLDLSGQMCTVRLFGEVDLTRADELTAVLHDACAWPGLKHLRIDLTFACFIDLTIAAILITGYRTTHDAGIGYALDREHGVVARALQIAIIMTD